jgi:MoaA/NifB/PqqE/SkfB family radical SAM enzyme
VLYTNCAYWDFHSDVLCECVDTVCVPIEGASELVHDGVRGRDSLRKVLSVIDRHGRGDGPFTIRVGTVVGRHNLNELEAILYMLEQYEIEAWTLYKHIRYTDRVVRHYFRRNRADISMAELEAAVRRLRDGKASSPPVLLSTEIVRDERLLLLNQDLELAVPIRGADGCLSERVLGNAAAMEMSEILRTWRDSVDITRCEEAVRVSL